MFRRYRKHSVIPVSRGLLTAATIERESLNQFCKSVTAFLFACAVACPIAPILVSDQSVLSEATPRVDETTQTPTTTASLQLVFEAASLQEKAELRDWLNDHYLASMEYSEHHIRTEIARVDPDLLADRLATSSEANRGPVLPTTSLTESATDIGLNLFSDTVIRCSVVFYQRGRHTGMKSVRLRTVSSVADTSTDNIFLEITAASEVRGVVDTRAGFYRIRQSPVIGLVVISEMEQPAVYEKLQTF